MTIPVAHRQISIEMIANLDNVAAAEWDALNPDGHPFTQYAFLHALEQSQSVGENTGWDPLYIIARDDSGTLVGAVPHYVKYNSYGEYVFDHAWANAFERAGGRYYPKLLGAVPFTPVPGPRLLYPPEQPEIADLLLQAVEGLMDKHQLSSAHFNFIPDTQRPFFESRGWLIRTGIQFHWHNDNYDDFDMFLAQLSSRKRKNIKKERNSLAAHGVNFKQLTRTDITAEIWDEFYSFYLSTIEKKWGGAYLSETFFPLMGRKMADHILLVMAYKENTPIAAALNFIGKDTLYGRNWGCSEELPNLHFETCYYQAIDFAIKKGFNRVEAGAQGFHKVQRGYLPVHTYSAHKLQHTGMSDAVSRFLQAETRQINEESAAILAASPYRSPDQG